MILRVFALLARPRRQDLSGRLLPALAFACVTALLALIVGGAQSFWRLSGEIAPYYQACTVVAMVILVVPLVSLGGAAARLQTRRRDDRLAALRLLGADGRSTAALAVLEAALVAFTGAVSGVLLSLAAAPLLGLLPFRGAPLGLAAVLLPAGAYAALIAAVTLIAALSAVLSLRRVIVSPLGVALKQTAPAAPWRSALIALGAIALAFTLMNNLAGLGSLAAVLAVMGVALTVTLFAVDVIGVWLTAVRARGQARRAQTPERLLAARAILESPRAAWRQVSGVAMASFMAVFAGAGVALLGVIDDAGASAEIGAHIVDDIRTGIIVTVVGTFVMVGCAVGVGQAAQIFDRADISRALAVMGTPLETQERARRGAVMQPLLLATVGPAVIAAMLLFPIVGGALILAPLSLLTVLSTLVLGVLIVWATLRATRPLQRRVATG